MQRWHGAVDQNAPLLGQELEPTGILCVPRLARRDDICLCPQKWPTEFAKAKGTHLGPHCLFSAVPFASIESVLVSSYVQLEFSNRPWPQELPENLSLLTASTSLPSRMFTALSLTTGSSCMAKGLVGRIHSLLTL